MACDENGGFVTMLPNRVPHVLGRTLRSKRRTAHDFTLIAQLMSRDLSGFEGPPVRARHDQRRRNPRLMGTLQYPAQLGPALFGEAPVGIPPGRCMIFRDAVA